MREQAAVLSPQLEHAAVLYRGDDEYVDAVLGFVAGGLERGEPVFVAVPGPKVGLLREHLDGQAGRVSFADMTEMGANPAWIIPRVAAFVDAHRGGPSATSASRCGRPAPPRSCVRPPGTRP